MGAVSSQRDRGDFAHDLGLSLHKHVLGVDSGNSAVSCTDEQVAVVQKLDRVDTS